MEAIFRVKGWELDCDCGNCVDLGVRFCGVEGIAQVVEECCTLPAQALLNIGVGQVGSVKEVSCGYSNGMTGDRTIS